jgi:hypothetical protein
MLKAMPLKIERLERGQQQLSLGPASDCLIFVENKNRKFSSDAGSTRATAPSNGRCSSSVATDR